MNSLSMHRPWHSLIAAFLVPLLAFLLACGPGEEPTPIPTATAIPTTAPAATPTSALPGPVASPTPTSVATPTPVPTPSEKPKYGGRLLVAPGDYMQDYDAQVSLSGGGFSTWTTRLYNNLLWNPQYDETECELCTEWHLENAGKTMVFTLFQGIKFHNGQEMTSADVKWSLRKMTGEVDGIASPRSGILREYIDSMETPSRYVLRINLVRPSLFLPKVLTIASSVIYPEGTTFADLKSEPRGSGPFILKQVVPGSSRSFDRNPNYFKPGLPYLDGVDIVFVADSATRVAQFLTQKAMWSGLPAVQFIPAFRKLEAEGKLNYGVTDGSNGTNAVYFNVSKPPFNDIKMRKAANLVLDRKAIGRINWGEFAKPQLMFYPQGANCSPPETDAVWDTVPGWGTGAKKQQEIEQARQLVKDAGYLNGIDIDQMARGTPALPTFGYWSGAEAIQQQLRDAGIRTTLSLVDGTRHQARMNALDFLIQENSTGIPTRDFDETIGTYFLTGASRNWSGYANPEVDRRYIEMSSELDPVKRQQMYCQIRDIIVLQDITIAPTQGTYGHIWWWKTLRNVAIGRDGTSHASTGFQRMDRAWLDR